MLSLGSALTGYQIAATDGPVGPLRDILVDDRSWTVRWLVVDAGGWLAHHKVLLHPSAVRRAVHDQKTLFVSLSRSQVQKSPSFDTDVPVSQQMQQRLYGYYGLDPLWGGGAGVGAFPGGIGPTGIGPTGIGPTGIGIDPEKDAGASAGDEGDPHLRSTTAVTSYHVLAADGAIGHVEDVLLDDHDWALSYFVIDTKNWWAGQHVLIAPSSVTEINWFDHTVQVRISRAAIKAGTPWRPDDLGSPLYQKALRAEAGMEAASVA